MLKKAAKLNTLKIGGPRLFLTYFIYPFIYKTFLLGKFKKYYNIK
jgi:hypothetical protein